jgi:putative membrane protein insertion efficiency factor
MKWALLVVAFAAGTLAVERRSVKVSASGNPALVATVNGGQALAIAGIHAYQRKFSGIAAHFGARCRFTPTCSRYAEAVITRDGLLRGGWKAAKRVVRCGPWTPMGSIDSP